MQKIHPSPKQEPNVHMLCIFELEGNPFAVYNLQSAIQLECFFCKQEIQKGKLLVHKNTENELIVCKECHAHLKEALTHDYPSLLQEEINILESIKEKYDILIQMTLDSNAKRAKNEVLASANKLIDKVDTFLETHPIIEEEDEN